MYSEKIIDRLERSVYRDQLEHGPVSVQVLPSGRCNAECGFCAIHSKKVPESVKKKFAPRLISDGGLLDFGIYKRFVDDLADLEFTRRIQYTGLGDPLMHPRFSEMAAYAREKLPEAFLVAVTNGVALEKHVDALLGSGLNQLTLSLNAGRPETWIKLNRKGTEKQFWRILAGLERLREKRAGDTPRVVLTAVLTRHNYQDIPYLVKIAKNCGIRIIGFSRMMPFVFGDFCANQDLLLSQDQFQEFLDSLEKSNAEQSEVKIHLWGKGPEDGSLNSSVDGALPPCYAGWWFAMLYPDGTIYPCCNCEKKLGDMTKASFKEIWQGETYIQFRRQALRINKTGGMKNCLCRECGFVTENRTYHELILDCLEKRRALKANKP